jgi:succinoglycan biosynthesis protein ExoV
MKLYVWGDETRNFGDELNYWLLPKVFPGLFDEDDSELFLGIGSTLFDFHPKESRKIVFGAGYGGYTAAPALDESWRVYCVRGPRTARALGLAADRIAGDTAILIRNHRPPAAPGRGFSFMPHCHSVERGNWAKACELAGVRFIDPTAPVDTVLEAIEASGTLIAEAMHGAIVADALRVPWIPVLPVKGTHRMKWHDWAEALELTLAPSPLWPSSLAEAWVTARGGKGEGGPLTKAKGALRAGVQVLDWPFVRLAAARLKALTRLQPMQSSDQAIDRALDRLETRAGEIRRDYPRG